MANNLIYPFGENASGNNILTDSAYQSDTQRLIGNQPGIARQELVNKVLKSDSVIAAAVAQLIADNQSSDVTDSLTYDALATMFRDALNRVSGVQASTITADTTLTIADAGLIEIDASAGNVTVTLESAATLAGLTFQLARTDSSSNTVTMSAAGNDAIEGASSTTLSPSDRVTLVADGGTSWRAAWATSSVFDPSSIISPGFIGWFANSSPPNGYIKANGAAISRSTYSGLFNAIGTTFGAGDGSTTFNVPDLRGEFIRGWDDGRGVDSGRGFGSFQDHAMQHLTGSLRQLAHGHYVNASANGVFTRSGDSSSGNAQGSGPTERFDFDNARQANTSTENRPRNLALLACIKY